MIFGFYRNSSGASSDFEKRRMKIAQIVPILFLLCMWMVKIAEVVLNADLYRLGVYPKRVDGLIGILTSSFVHSDFKHLITNSVPFYVLSVFLFYFYRNISYLIFFLNLLLSGILLWFIGRSSWHIGASGIIYGMAFFLFFSGLFRGDTKLLTIALITAFLYGSFFWGLFPSRPEVSWEAHLSGALSGLFLSVIFRNYGPPRPDFPFEEEEEAEESLDSSDSVSSEHLQNMESEKDINL